MLATKTKSVDVAEFLKAIAKDTPENKALIEQLIIDLCAATIEP
ncbi:hypothetical protein ACFWMP_14095 [Paenibacillus sp. NPDC058367]